MTILLSNDEIACLLNMKDVLEALETAYLEAAAGRAILGTRAEIITETTHPESVYQSKMMSSSISSLGVGAVRINSDILSFPTVGGKKRRKKVPLAPGDRWTGLVLLFSTRTGEPLMIFPDGVMQRMRVAGASALGAKYMAREDAKTVALIGSGWQAGAQAMAIAVVRNVEQIRVYSMTRNNRDNFCQQISPEIGVDMHACEDIENAVMGADIVLCATNSQSNVLFRKFIKPGMHISTIRDNEIELAAIKAADHVVMHDSSSMDFDHYNNTHGIKVADQKKEAGNSPDMAYLREVPTLADLITGSAKGRTSENDITCFLNYRGLAIQFAAVGAILYERAKAQNIGNHMPTEWFTEDVLP